MMERREPLAEPTDALKATVDHCGVQPCEGPTAGPEVLAYRVRSQTWLIPTKLSA